MVFFTQAVSSMFSARQPFQYTTITAGVWFESFLHRCSTSLELTTCWHWHSQYCYILDVSPEKQCFWWLSCAGDSFLYFGFGSNLLAARILLQNPSAVFHTTACLSDYHLSFDCASSEWMGASATITSQAGDHVWGVVWLIKSSELSNLDDQEGVHDNVYKVPPAVIIIIIIINVTFLLQIWVWCSKCAILCVTVTCIAASHQKCFQSLNIEHF